MKKTTFTDEQISILKANPYTYNVTPAVLKFTLEFKTIFLERYKAGEKAEEIFRDMGYDPEMVGITRIHRFRDRMVNDAKNGREIVEGYRKHAPKDYSCMTAAETIQQMQQEIIYLHQELDFIKKF